MAVFKGESKRCVTKQVSCIRRLLGPNEKAKLHAVDDTAPPGSH